MGAPFNDEVVTIKLGKNSGDPIVITVNCADKIGLTCDFARVIFDYGLTVVRGDVSTDGKWCYLIFWVLPRPGSPRRFPWAMLRKNLTSICPPNPAQLFFGIYSDPKPPKVYVLQISLLDRAGLLNDMSQVLWDLEFSIQKVKASTTPDGRVMDLFFVIDNRDMLHSEKRQVEACNRIKTVLGESATHCEIRVVPDLGTMDCASFSLLRPSIIEDLCKLSLTDSETDAKSVYANKNVQATQDLQANKGLQATNFIQANGSLTSKISVTIDNSLSPAHTLLQISCKDRKGLFYDVLRTLKDYNIQISYGRLSTNAKGICEVDLFILQADGRKIIDPQKQTCLRSRLEIEVSHPVRVKVVDRGPDTELLVASRVEICGRCRPRVLYDVTLVLKTLDISIFTADLVRYAMGDLQWEVYRFLLVDRPDLLLESSRTRSHITERIENMLIG
ncbi:hypothetical protein SUGI_1112780 [Cryptomeria japonica]|uniref:ACT domain-containing protein ACR9 n=1 Tax=Cryptomeria japonica TaxID=3369 RepID=UPI002414CDB3|nr:ACT domain-containing protein ACR9 [Cryptomeria japonica]XP_057839508.2 ACT domain-containing protein ACR9 [Cryptomeria japonica]GLJ52316.1 hypothetical protein SUGI_1112780 [Cryptomeria japonica]